MRVSASCVVSDLHHQAYIKHTSSRLFKYWILDAFFTQHQLLQQSSICCNGAQVKTYPESRLFGTMLKLPEPEPEGVKYVIYVCYIWYIWYTMCD